MSIINYDFKELLHNASLAKETKWKPTLPLQFLDHVIPILAALPLIRENGKISSYRTFNEMPDIMYTVNKESITKENMQNLIKFLSIVPRSELLNESQIRAPRFAAFTPLPLYAHKLHHGVSYGEWEKNDPLISGFLGQNLKAILDVTIPPVIDNLTELRREALEFKTGAKKGTLDKLTAYKCNLKHINGREYPKIAIMMYLQLWLANSSVRNTDSMILDPINWDNVPEPYDAVQPLAPLKARKQIEVLKELKESGIDWL